MAKEYQKRYDNAVTKVVKLSLVGAEFDVPDIQVWCGVGGTADITMEDDTVHVGYPLLAGANRIDIKKIDNVVTVANVYGHYSGKP